MRRDYHRIINASDGLVARRAYDAFTTKWSKLCPAVARSIEEAAALTLLNGLVAFGQIRMHKIDGHRELRALTAKMNAHAA